MRESKIGNKILSNLELDILLSIFDTDQKELIRTLVLNSRKGVKAFLFPEPKLTIMGVPVRFHSKPRIDVET